MHEQHRNPRAVSVTPRDAATIDHTERARIAAHDKRVAALSGWRLDVLPSGMFEMWRWSRCRQFDSLDAAESFITSLQVAR